MATTETLNPNEFPLAKDNYLAFDAISLRNLIIQRLNDQGIFTDQNYIGSNLASIIDIVSYSFNTLMFYLNKTSTESIFTEAQLYENINKIVKLLDYKPIGFQTSTLAFQCSAVGFSPGNSYTIPRYSYLSIGNIPFSFNEDVTFVVDNSNVAELTDVTNKKLLYQGIFRESPTHVAAGDENEIVYIDVSNINVDHFNIDVYVYENQQNKWVKYEETPSLYVEQGTSRVFEKRLNQSLFYEITFGNGVNGRRLLQGDKVIVYYLQSSREKGVVGPKELALCSKTLYNTNNFSEILRDVNERNYTFLSRFQFSNLFFNNNVGSTVFQEIESVESIKTNAPANFKSQYRLVTKTDFETYIKTNFANFINDVRVFSNWDYTSKYLKYFNDVQVSPSSFRQILFNQLSYSDSCNFNNVYICGVPKVSKGSTLKYLLPSQKEIILTTVQDVKMLTTEITFLDPIYKALSFGVKLADGSFAVSDKEFTQLQIVKTPYSKRSSRSIQTEIEATFSSFFDLTFAKLGGMLNYSSLISALLSIEGVSQIRTKRLDTNEQFEGLSLIMWNPNYPDLDKKIIVNDLELQDFEYVYFEELQNIGTKIQIIENQTYIA